MDSEVNPQDKIQRIVESVKITLYHPMWEGYPVHFDRLFNFLILDPKIGRISRSELEEAIQSGGFPKLNSFIGLNEDGFSAKVSEVERLNAISREKYREAEKILSGLDRHSYVRYVGVTGLVSFGLAGESDAVDVIILAPKGSHNVSAAWANLAKIKSKVKFNFIIDDEIVLPADRVAAAYQLLNLATIVNTDKTFESIIGACPWIFEIFRNYPLDKVSFNFRVNNKAAIEEVSGFVKWMDGIMERFLGKL